MNHPGNRFIAPIDNSRLQEILSNGHGMLSEIYQLALEVEQARQAKEPQPAKREMPRLSLQLQDRLRSLGVMQELIDDFNKWISGEDNENGWAYCDICGGIILKDDNQPMLSSDYSNTRLPRHLTCADHLQWEKAGKP